MQAQPQFARLNTYHSPKQRLLGNQAGHAAPAWRTNGVPGKKPGGPSNTEMGSKIILSKLPLDVVENEVEVLFTRTVGPVKDVFMVYNSQGKSKGMAVVSFQRPGDAVIARGKYNGKIVDGRRPIKIEIIVDEDGPQKIVTPPPNLQVPSLLQRLGATIPPPAQSIAKTMNPPTEPRKQSVVKVLPTGPRQPVTNPKVRLRTKKGPKRVQKLQKKSLAELDQEMEDYRANAS